MDDLVWWLRLAVLNDTAARKNELLVRFGGPAAALQAGAEAWQAAGLDAGRQARLREAAARPVEAELAALQRCQAAVVPRGDPAYPPLLATIDDPPALLFVRGRLPAATLPCVALVGTRRTSPYGELVAEDLAKGLAAAGVGVVSGLAAGIDARAHEGALRAGGYTAAVLGCGVDVVYPAENRDLSTQVAAAGGVISEFPPGTQPRGWHFPLRNRIISGLCRGVVVVQAPADSGALITARLAMEQNREVMAVPGPITDHRHAGAHALLRDGAVLVRGVEDVLQVLQLERPAEAPLEPAAAAPLPPLEAHESAVAGVLGLAPIGIDDIIERLDLSTAEVQSALVTLELKQVARRLPGNRFVRVA